MPRRLPLLPFLSFPYSPTSVSWDPLPNKPLPLDLSVGLFWGVQTKADCKHTELEAVQNLKHNMKNFVFFMNLFKLSTCFILMLGKYLNVKLALLDINIYQGDTQSCGTPLFLSTLYPPPVKRWVLNPKYISCQSTTLCSHWKSKMLVEEKSLPSRKRGWRRCERRQGLGKVRFWCPLVEWLGHMQSRLLCLSLCT